MYEREIPFEGRGPNDGRREEFNALMPFLFALGERYRQLKSLEQALHADPMHLEFNQNKNAN